MRWLHHAGFAAIVTLLITVPTPALAGVPIPCTGDRAIQVSETGVKRKDGSTVYLGYKFKYCVYGEWIGYIDSRRYISLPNEEAATQLALASGFTELPEPPGRLSNPGAFWVEWMWGVLGIFGLAGGLRSAGNEA
jgi:hypothetical protein